MSLRLGAIIGGAALGTWLLRRHAGRWVADNPNAMTGIAVIGLLLAAVGEMCGMHKQILVLPEQAALFLALAFLANAGLPMTGALDGMRPTQRLTSRRAVGDGLDLRDRSWRLRLTGFLDPPGRRG